VPGGLLSGQFLPADGAARAEAAGDVDDGRIVQVHGLGIVLRLLGAVGQQPILALLDAPARARRPAARGHRRRRLLARLEVAPLERRRLRRRLWVRVFEGAPHSSHRVGLVVRFAVGLDVAGGVVVLAGAEGEAVDRLEPALGRVQHRGAAARGGATRRRRRRRRVSRVHAAAALHWTPLLLLLLLRRGR